MEPADPVSLMGGAALLAVVAFAAAWIPARRAARVDPAVALREEQLIQDPPMASGSWRVQALPMVTVVEHLRELRRQGGRKGDTGEATAQRLVPVARRPEIPAMSLSPVELEALRRLSPARKLAVMHALIEQAWSIKSAMIRERRPDLGPDEVARRAREAVAGERA